MGMMSWQLHLETDHGLFITLNPYGPYFGVYYVEEGFSCLCAHNSVSNNRKFHLSMGMKVLLIGQC